MLMETIGELLPSAVGVMLSPVPLIAVIVMLGTSRARTNGPAFALGWIVGLLIVSGLVLVLASDAEDPTSGAATNVSFGKLVLGVLFLFLAFRQWQSRPAPGEEAELPAWMASLDEMRVGRAFVLGTALSGINPKNLALTAAAAATIASEPELTRADSLVAVGVFVLVGSLSVAGPVVAYLVATDRVAAPLASVKEFMVEHNAVIMMVVFLILGAKLLGQGLALEF